ncbi:hypothetical protein V2J09_008246 [Rumex salicifolius]
MHGKPMHPHIISTGHESDEYVKNSLITMYAKCGDLDSSNFVFSGVTNVNHITYNAMVAANARHRRGEEALKLFAEMYGLQRELDQFRFSSAFAAAANLAALEEGTMLHVLVVKLGTHGDMELGKVGAQKLIELGPTDDSAKVLYSNVCATTGRWDDVENVRNQMEVSEIKNQPACSWVKLKNKVNCFGMGDYSHPHITD